jgi:hypothetical protein
MDIWLYATEVTEDQEEALFELHEKSEEQTEKNEKK